MIGSYKDEHETFVSNGKGTSVMCVFICLAHAPALIYGLKVCQQATGPNIFRDICFMTIPAVLTLTVLAEFNHITALFLYFLVAVHRVQKYHVIITESENNAQPFSHIATNHLTLYKGINCLFRCELFQNFYLSYFQLLIHQA